MKIKDTKFLRYISRMFKAGILTQGELTISEEGVPHGSCQSPIKANIFAHYVIDLWLEEVVKPRMAGKIRVFRYADDLIICRQYENDAIRVKEVLSKRLDKYKLKLNEEKTKLVSFSKMKSRQGVKQGTFDFLGFTFYLGKSVNGYIILKLKTNGKRVRAKLKRVNELARQIKDKQPLGMIWKTFNAKLRGHIQYYGVSLNYESIKNFSGKATEIMFKWLNRRSQRKSFDWEKFKLYIEKHPLPTVKINHKLFGNSITM